MRAVVRYLAERLGEPTTWKGIFLIVTATGISIRPDMQEAILTVGLTMAGAIGVAMPDPQAGE